MGAVLILLLLVAAGFGFWLFSRILDDQKAAALNRRERDKLLAQYGLDRVYVSPFDGSVVGLSLGRGTIALGGREGLAEYPLADVAEVAGLRDGQVLTRTSRTPPVEGQGAEVQAGDGPPLYVNSLTLRITLDHAGHPAPAITFFDWPGKGVRPYHNLFMEQAREVEAWYRAVADAMRSVCVRAG